VKITLDNPNADLPVILGTPHFMIVKDGTTDFSKGIGTGPYTVKEFSPGVRSVAVRNANYWKSGKPYLDEIEYFSIEDETARLNAMLAGDIDVASQIGPRALKRVKSSPGFAVFETPSGNYNDFIFRQDADPTRNQDLVMAIKYLFDREQMQAALGGVIGNDQPIDPTHRYYNASLPQRPYDPDKAKFHFAKSGLGNTPLPLYAMAGNTMTDQAVILQQSALGIGMTIDIQRMPKDGYWANVWMKHPFTLGNINPRPSADSRCSSNPTRPGTRAPGRTRNSTACWCRRAAKPMRPSARRCMAKCRLWCPTRAASACRCSPASMTPTPPN
jgi:peptide/nickel transport system substrate-binding protein